MSRLFVAMVCCAVADMAMAGGLAEPVMEPQIVVEGVSASGQFTLPFLLIVLIAAVLSGG